MSYTPFKMKGPSLYRNNSATKNVGNKPKDINKNGQIEGWEQARFDAIKSNSPNNYGKHASPNKVIGSTQESGKREDNRTYKDDKNVVRSAGMQRLMDNKPDASDKEAMKRWQAAYDKAFNAFKKKKGDA